VALLARQYRCCVFFVLICMTTTARASHVLRMTHTAIELPILEAPTSLNSGLEVALRLGYGAGQKAASEGTMVRYAWVGKVPTQALNERISRKFHNLTHLHFGISRRGEVCWSSGFFAQKRLRLSYGAGQKAVSEKTMRWCVGLGWASRVPKPY